MEKQRLIVDYKNITAEQLQILTDKYPEGFDPDDMIVYKNSEGKTVRTIPLETETTKYLFKISVELERKAAAFLEDDDDQDDVSDDDAAPDAEAVEEDAPSSTLSPTFFNQEATVPSSIVSLRRGMFITSAIAYILCGMNG